jgi:hypothetical protein
MTETPTDIRERSVTAGEAGTNASYFFLPLSGFTQRMSLAPVPPAWWSQARDYALRSTIQAEDMWAAAMFIAITKVQAAGFEVESEVGLRARLAHQLLNEVDFLRGNKRFMAKLARDYLLTDNGAFVEIIRASKAQGAKIIGLAHLDSLRCTRTGDDEVPVVYTDMLGKPHELRYYDVIDLVDMPDPSESWNGVGLCAASRAYRTICKMAAMEQYISESVSGRTPTKLSFIGGMPQRMIEDAMKSANAQADARGLTTYMGAVVQAALSDKALTLVEINLKEMPAGFNVEQERTDAYLKYADCIGVDPQELQPLTGRPLGTATQSMVLDDKQRGKGLVAFFGTFTEQLNLKVLPDATTFHFLENDYRDQQAQAAVKQTRATTRAAQIASGEITAQQALQMAVDEGDVPKEFLPVDQTPDDTLADDEKPEDVAAAVADEAQAAQPDEAQPAPVAQPAAEAVAVPVATKELTEKARVELVNLAPQFTRPKFSGRGETTYLQQVTKEMDAYMRALRDVAREECPVSDKEDGGAMQASIDYLLRNRNTRSVEGVLYAGNKERPEVAVRAVLYGRRGFGPKDPNGSLAFEGSDGEMVYAKHVSGTAPNDWFKRAWDRTAKERTAMAQRIGALEAEAVKVTDVPLANRPNIDGYDEDKGDEVPNTKRNRIKGGVAE